MTADTAPPRERAGRYAPRPGAAPLPRMVLAQGLVEARLILRQGEQLVLALVIPLLVLVGDVTTTILDIGPGRRADIVTPGVLALAVLSTAFTSVAIATGFERRYGVLKRLGATPLPRAGLLAGKALGVVLIELLQLVVLCGVGLAVGWRPAGGPGAAGIAVGLVLLGTWALAALGLSFAGTLRADATLAAANLVYLILLILGAILVPLAKYPTGMHWLVQALPSGALAEGLRQVLSGAGLPWWSPVALGCWAVAATAFVARTFRWD